jgi:hypothetical protein
MSKETIFGTDQITVWYYPEKKIIHHEMHKYTHGQVFRDALMAGLEAMKKYRAQKWLSDDRNNPVLDAADTEWNMAHWLPQVIEAGWRYWAIVQPQEFAAKSQIDTLTKELGDRGITVRIFNDPEKAMKWLEDQ